MAVKSFRFYEDQYGITKDIYIDILSKLGIENPEKYLEEKLSTIPEEKKDGLMFNRIVGELFKDDDERRKKAAQVLEEIKDDKEVSPYVVGYLGEMAGDYIPFDTVLTAGKTVGDGKSLQMGCGEGKTGVLSLAAYAKLQDPNKQVFLTSSTPILAAEALDKLEFYNRVGIADKVCLISKEGITRAKIDEEGKTILGEDGKVERETISFEGKTEEEISKLLEEAYKMPLVSSDNATLMEHAMKGYLPKPEPGKERELLADEADFVLLDSYRPMQQTEKMTEEEISKSISQREEAYKILQSLEKEGLYVLDDANQYVDFTDKGREKVVEKINEIFGNDPSIDKNKIFDYVYDALVVDTVYRENRDYQILDEGRKIVSEDRASGVEIDLPQGVKQALEIKLQQEGKYTGEISEEEAVLDTLNVQSFFKEYFNGRKHFVSGTLGIDSEEIAEELDENFGVSKQEGDIYEIPPKGKGIRDDQGKTMFKGQDEKRKAIIDNALSEIENGRPVLIGTVSEEEINALRAELESRGLGDKIPRVIEYTAASEEKFKADKEKLTKEEFEKKYAKIIEVEEKDFKLDDEEFTKKYNKRKDELKAGEFVNVGVYKSFADYVKGESGKSDTITLGTSIIGRGTTIKTSSTINGKDGIHVIIDGLHETSSRNQEQYKARTARGTNAGSTKEFFCLDDIPEEYREEFEGRIDDPDGVYADLYKKIDERTGNIRKYVVELVQETREHIEAIKLDPRLSDEEKLETQSLLLARAFSIKNRACGVSSEDRVEQYKKEIEAYRKMYTAKYSNKDKEFDEVKWLKENGYEDMAKRHIPFSKEREDKIFTMTGIKSQVEQSRTGEVDRATKDTKEAVINPNKDKDKQTEQQENGDERDD